MKSTVFTKAWEIKRTLNVAFSEALIKAWNYVKFEAACEKEETILDAFGMPNKSDLLQSVRRAKLSMRDLYTDTKTALLAAMPSAKVTIVNNEGARFHYDGKTFNND